MVLKFTFVKLKMNFAVVLIELIYIYFFCMKHGYELLFFSAVLQKGVPRRTFFFLLLISPP